MKTALVHDWLNGMRGGEKCLEVLCELYPDATVHTLFYEPGKVSREISRHRVKESWLARIPGARSSYRHLLPLFPAAVESFDMKPYDLVVSTSHCVAKGAKRRKGAAHVCYCFTPMRYAWTFFDDYFGGRGALTRGLIRRVLEGLKKWDLRANSRVDRFVAISKHVQKRIETYYGRPSEVIYPPCDVDFYTPGRETREDFYLIVSALVPYKKIDLAIAALAGKRLVVIGDGPERKKIEKDAPEGVQFLGWKPDEALRDYYRRARALVFPGEEDFGIVPVEAQACGCPVIAYGVGGALETVVDGRTGVFFSEPTAASLRGAAERFEAMSFDPAAARENALRFSRERFKNEIRDMIQRATIEKRGERA